MGFGLFFLPIAGGYVFVTYWLGTRFLAANESGHRLVFRAASVGVALYVVAGLIVLLGSYYLPDTAATFGRMGIDGASATALLSFAIGATAWVPLNVGLDRATALSTAAAETGAVLEQALLDAAQTTELMMVSLSDRKVYIGFVRRISDPGAATRELALLPVISGYRDEVTLVFTPTTYYYDALLAAGAGNQPELDDPQIERFRLIIPIAEVRTARQWRPEIAELFEPDEDLVESG